MKEIAWDRENKQATIQVRNTHEDEELVSMRCTYRAIVTVQFEIPTAFIHLFLPGRRAADSCEKPLLSREALHGWGPSSMLDFDNEQLFSVVLSGLSTNDDMASPTVRNISFLSSWAVKNIQTTLMKLQKITVRHIGRLNSNWHFSSILWLKQ